MQWDGSRQGGFTTGEPWLPVAFEAMTVNVAAQQDDPASTLALYRDLIRCRRASPALRGGTYQTVDGTPPDVFAYLRSSDDERWLIVLNFGEAAHELELGARGLSGTVRLSSRPDRQVDGRTGDRLTMETDEGVLIELTG